MVVGRFELFVFNLKLNQFLIDLLIFLSQGCEILEKLTRILSFLKVRIGLSQLALDCLKVLVQLVIFLLRRPCGTTMTTRTTFLVLLF